VKKLGIGILLALLAIAAVMAPSLVAQSLVSGDLAGTVTDPSGAVVPNTTVTLKSNATGEARTTTTNANGDYRFSLLRPGSYSVSVAAQGFSTADTTVNVNVGQASVGDVKMAVGANSQTVEVTSSAPLVNADNADLSTNFNQNMIANSPNGGNDITYVAQTAPGVMMNTGGGYGNFSSYGLPATSNLFTVNGENDMDPYFNLNNSGATNLTLGKNDVEEATVVNNAYSGQYGQQAGAQISYVTKSGSNQYHGNAEYWWTGRAMDANDWFNNLNSTPRPFANNNEWADSFGGPIKKDKIFFFADNEGIRYIVPSSGPVYVPSPTFIGQTLSNLSATAPNEVALYQKLFNLYTSAPGYNGTNYIPGSCGGVLNTFNPAFTANNCFSTYQTTPALPGTEWILSGRVDVNFSDKDHAFWRVRMDHGTQATLADPFNNALSSASYQPAYDGQGQWNHVFSPNATNQFIYAGSYYRAIFTQNDPSVFPYSVISTGFNLGQPNGITSNSFNFPQGRNVTQYQFVDDFSWTKGAHALKFGGNFRRYDITDYTFSVLNNPEILLGDISGFGDGGQTDFYDGIAEQTRQRFPSRSTEPVALWGLGVYGQDEWRVNKQLKLTLALRAEHNSNPVCQLDCGALLTGDFTTMLANGLITPNTPYSQMIDANRHQIYRSTDAIDLSPRFGFAWSPGGRDTTVVRGGFGIFYDALPAVVGDQFMLNLPNVVTVYSNGVPWGDTTASGPYVQGQQAASAIMSGFAGGATYNSLVGQLGSSFKTPTINSQVGTFHTPYYEQWSFGIQQAVGDKTSLSVGYVGNHGVHIPVYNQGLNAFMNGNTSGFNIPPFPATPLTGCGNAACTSSAIFANVQQYSSSAISNYNGLTASFTQRVTYGFSVQASYTWSHALDEVSNSGIGQLPYNVGTSLVYQINPACLACNNYGNADYDIRNYFSASFVWQTPFKFGSKYMNGALGGWTISQNFFARSGLPTTVVDGNSFIANFTPSFGNNVAEVVGGVPGQGGCVNGFSQCLNPAAFTTAVTNFPNQTRNQYRGPGFFDSDFTINKNFKLTERFAFGVGANFYNVFNHPNFTNPDSNLADSTFGQTTTTTAPPTGPYGAFFTGLPSGRIIQFQGKLVF
jgi:hypothetical protein